MKGHDLLSRNLKKYKPEQITEVRDHLFKQINEIYSFCYEKNILFDRKTIKKMDTINIIDFDFPDSGTDAYETAKSNFFTYIPPLEKGVLRGTLRNYMYFEVYEIDLENQTYSLILHDYRSDSNDDYFPWSLTCYGDLTIIKEDGLASTVQVNDFYGFDSFVQDYMIDDVPLYKLVWSNKLERQFFKDTTVPMLEILSQAQFAQIKLHGDWYSKEDAENEEENDSKENLSEPDSKASDYLYNTAAYFLLQICDTNYMLSKNRPIAERGKYTKHKVHEIQETDPSKMPKKQIIRSVGGIKIKSVKIPKMPTEESVRKYKVSSWNKRGHVRHYKNGKIVYIKPTVCQRKCFKGNGNPLQTIINIENRRVKR